MKTFSELFEDNRRTMLMAKDGFKPSHEFVTYDRHREEIEHHATLAAAKSHVKHNRTDPEDFTIHKVNHNKKIVSSHEFSHDSGKFHEHDHFNGKRLSADGYSS